MGVYVAMELPDMSFNAWVALRHLVTSGESVVSADTGAYVELADAGYIETSATGQRLVTMAGVEASEEARRLELAGVAPWKSK